MRWQYSADMDQGRLASLQASPPFETIIEEITKALQDSASGMEVLCCHSAPAQDIVGANDFHRIIYCLQVSLQLFDFFFNSPNGYRAAYFESPYEGLRANDHALQVLMPVLIKAPVTGTVTQQQEFIKESLTSPTAKLWLPEAVRHGCQKCKPEWDATSQMPEVHNGRWEKASTQLALWGRKAPWLTKIHVIGAFLNGQHDEVVAEHKRRRAWDIHAYGWT